MVKVPVNTARRASVARLARATLLAFVLAFAPEACTVPKFTAGSGVRGDITPQSDTPPKADTVVVSSSKEKKHHTADVILIYAVALVLVALLYLKISNTDAH